MLACTLAGVEFKNGAPNWERSFGKEMYNHSSDPGETVNMHRQLSSSMEGTLRDRLRGGWQNAFLKVVAGKKES